MLSFLDELMVFGSRAPFSSNIGLDAASTRDALVSIIAYQPNLSCTQVTTILRKFRDSNISQQAVFKTLNMLVDEGVLMKDERKYCLNQTWVQKGKSFFNDVEQRNKGKAETILLL